MAGTGDLNDWAATGCVEPTISGKHLGHTNCMMFNMVADLACEYNNLLGEAHAVIRPTPLLSSMIEGCTEKGIDCTRGGAKYNSSGTAWQTSWTPSWPSERWYMREKSTPCGK